MGGAESSGGRSFRDVVVHGRANKKANAKKGNDGRKNKVDEEEDEFRRTRVVYAEQDTDFVAEL